METLRIEREKQLAAYHAEQELAKAEYLKRVEAEKAERELKLAEYQKELEAKRIEREAEIAKYQAEQEVKYAELKQMSEKRAATLRAEAELREKEWRTYAASLPVPSVSYSYVRTSSPARDVVMRVASPVREVRYGSPYRVPTYAYGPGYTSTWVPGVDYRMSGSPIRAYSPTKKSTLADTKDDKDQIDTNKKK